MDLSFARRAAGTFASPSTRVAGLPTGLAVLLVGVAARQAASPTARMQARLAVPDVQARVLAPAGGAFSAATATLLRAWGRA